MSILVYTRRRVKKFYHKLAELAFPGEDLVYFSDDRFCEKNYIMENFESVIEKPNDVDYLSVQDIHEIKTRCRYLRSKTDEESDKMIRAIWVILEKLIDKTNAKIGFGLAVDSYVLDVFQRVLKSKGRDYYSIVPTALNNYSRITSKGEMVKLRSVEREEVKSALNMITDRSYKPWYVSNGAAHIKKKLFPYYIKDMAKVKIFSILSKIEDNRYGFYYGSHFLNEPMMLCDKLENCNPYKFFDYNWESKIEDKKDVNLIYMPLQFYPECSTDYWNEDLFFTNYYDLLFEQVRQLEDSDILVLIKEHPVALGYRDINIYKELAKISNVILVPQDVPSTQLIELSDCVISGGTSTAIESYVKNKLILTNGRIVYDADNFFEKITEEVIENKQLKSFVVEKIKRYQPNNRIEELVQWMLECSIPINFNPLLDPQKDLEQIELQGNIISKYLGSILIRN